MRKLALKAGLVVGTAVAAGVLLPQTAYAIGSFDASHVKVKEGKVEFRIANLDRTNDGDHGGYDGVVVYSNIYCADTGTIVASTPNNVGPWNKGDKIKYEPVGYDGSAHTDCYLRIYTNDSLNDYESRTTFSIPTN